MKSFVTKAIQSHAKEAGFNYRLSSLAYCFAHELYVPIESIKPKLESLPHYGSLSELEGWCLELHKESPTTVEEGYALSKHLGEYLREPWELEAIKECICSVFPETRVNRITLHPFWKAVSKNIRGTAFDRPRELCTASAEALARSSVAREAVMGEFLSTPDFEKTFREFWRRSREGSSIRKTRALILAAAILEKSCDWTNEKHGIQLKNQLHSLCYFSEQTIQDFFLIMKILTPAKPDPVWLAHSFALDAMETDVRSFAELLNCFEQLCKTNDESRQRFIRVVLDILEIGLGKIAKAP